MSCSMGPLTPSAPPSLVIAVATLPRPRSHGFPSAPKAAEATPTTRASITTRPTIIAVTRPIHHAPEKMVLAIVPSFLQDGFVTTVRVLRRGRRRGIAAPPHRRRLFVLTGL